MIKGITMYQVVCDKCGRIFKETMFGIDRFDSSLSAINTSKSECWEHENGKSYCPYCSKHKNEVKINANRSGCPF